MSGTRFVVRALLWLLRRMVGLVPALGVLCAGALYLWNCTQALLAPGVPVRLRYASAGGIAEAHAASYVVSISPLAVTASTVTLQEPGKGQAVSVGRLSFVQEGARQVIRLKGLKGRLVRRKDGTLDLSDFGLKPDGKPDTSVLRVEADRAELEVVDEAAPHPRPHRLVLESLVAEGSAGDWTAAAKLTGLGSSRQPLTAVVRKDGSSRVETNARGLELAPFLALLRADGYLTDRGEVGSLRLTGPVGVEFRGGQVVPFGDVAMAAVGLTYPDWAQSARLEGRVSGRGDVWSGNLRWADGGMSGEAAGGFQIGQSPSADATVEVRAKDVRAVPSALRKLWPKEIGFGDGLVRGRVVWAGGTPSADLAVTAGWVAHGANRMTHVSGNVVSNDRVVAVELDGAKLGGGTLVGRLVVGVKDQSLRGGFRSKGDIGSFVAQYIPKELKVVGSADVLVSGTLTRPVVAFGGSGSARYQIEGGREIQLDRWTARAELRGSDIALQAWGSGAIGALKIAGIAKEYGQQLDLVASLSDVRVDVLDPAWKGVLQANGTVKGTAEKPVADLVAHMVGLEGNGLSIPVSQGKVGWADSVLSLVGVEGLYEGGTLRVDAAWNPTTDALEGGFSARNVSVAELGLAGAFGRLNLSGGTVGGTLKQPRASALAELGQAYIQHFKVDRAQAKLTLVDGRLSAADLVARAEGGSLTGRGSFDLASRDWEANLIGDRLPLDRLRLEVAEANPGGALSFKGTIRGTAEKVKAGEGDLTLDEGEMFGQSIGSGSVVAVVADGVVTAKGAVGDLDKYIGLTNAEYDLGSGRAKFAADISNLNLGQVLKAVATRAKDLDSNVRQGLRSVDALVSARLEGESVESAPWRLRMPVFLADKLKVQGNEAGQIRADFGREGQTWTVNSLTWHNKGGAGTVSGKWTDDGPVSGELSLTGVDAELVRGFLPNLPLRDGKLTELNVSLEGTSTKPVGRASATLQGLLFSDAGGNPVNVPLDLSLDNAVLADGILTIDGNFAATGKAAQAETAQDLPLKGVTGIVRATVPIDLFAEGSKREYSVDLKLSQPRPASALAAFVAGIDPARTTGEMTGSLHVHGTKDDARFELLAELAKGTDGKDATVAARGSSFSLTGASAQLRVTESSALFTADSRTSEGGSASIRLKGDYPDLVQNGFSFDALFEKGVVDGSVKFESGFKAALPQAAKPSLGDVSAELLVRGPVRRPVVTGTVAASRVDLSLPLFFEAAPAGAAPFVDPQFDEVRLLLAAGAKVEAPLASLVFDKAEGTLRGSLTQPVLTAPLYVDKGTVKLPSSRIRLEPGSQVTVALSETGQPRLVLDVRGHTSFTKRVGQDQYQHYDLELDIKGNLLAQEPLSVVCPDRPPGVTDEEIQAVVTQRSLIEGILGTATGKADATATRNILYSLAVPSLSDVLTEPLAKSLGLDFLSLDYNPFDQTVLNAGKSLTRDVTLQFTRQLVAPINALPREELRLSYRLPVKDRFLSQLRFVLTKTQVVPWRLGLTWGGRL